MNRLCPLAATVLASALAACGGRPGDGGAGPGPAPAAAPHLGLSPAALTFSATAGGRDPSPQDLTVSNTGAGALIRPTVTPGAAWITAAVTGGGPDYTVIVSVDVSGLPAGHHDGSVTFANNADNSPRTVGVALDLAPARTAEVARVVVTSGGFLLTEPGEGTRVWASALDRSGAALDVRPTWRSLSPDVISVGDDGIAFAVGPVGSAQLVAEAGGITSAPVMGVVAVPVAGAVVLYDSDLAGPPAAVDPAAPFGPGWQYAIRVFGDAPLAAGTAVLSRGREQVAGRVLSHRAGPESTELELELVPLRDLFADLRLSATVPFRDLAPALGSGTPSFTCAGAPAGLDVTLREAAIPLPDLVLHAELDVAGGTATLQLAGTLSAAVTVDVSLPAGFDGATTCEAPIGVLDLGWPGALALTFPSRFPYGVGLVLSGASAGDLTLTQTLQLDASAAGGLQLGAGPARLDGAFDLQPALSLLPAAAMQAYRAEVQPYLLGKLSVGPGWALASDPDLLELRAGSKAVIDWVPAPLQAADRAFAASWSLAAFADVAPAEDAATTLTLLNLFGATPSLETAPGVVVPVRGSPTGSLTADPARAAPGDPVTLTVELPGLASPTGLSPAGRVEIFRRVAGTTDALALVCAIAPDAPAQQRFSCTASFADAVPGERVELYAFTVDPDGLLPAEVSPDSLATVTMQ